MAIMASQQVRIVAKLEEMKEEKYLSGKNSWVTTRHQESENVNSVEVIVYSMIGL